MSNTPQRPPDSFEEPLMAAYTLFRKGKREEACRFLARKRDEEVTSGAREDAALYASVRGSYLVAMGRDSDALEAYLEAEELSNHESHCLLRTARHLLSMNQPERALEKANVVMASTAADHGEIQEVNVIRGLAFLGLGLPKKAINELQTIVSHVDHLASQSCDLMFVEALCQKNLEPELCQRYLDVVESKAREDGEERVLKRVLKSKELLK
jgi:tetratricopeptide (TPR) repeat protein